MHKRLLLTSLFLYYLAVLGVYFFLPDSTLKLTLQYIVTISSLIVAVFAGIYSLIEYGIHGPKSLTLMYLTLGIGCWFVGESIWTFYEVNGMNPFPSIADMFYILGYPLMLAAFLQEIITAKVNWNGVSKSLLFLLTLVSILLGLAVGYFGIFIAYSPAVPLFNNIVAMGYGIGDLVLIITSMALLILAWEYRGGELSSIWMALFCSFVLVLCADLVFILFNSMYDKVGIIRGLTDSIFILAYLLFAYALLNYGFTLQQAQMYLTDKHIKQHKKDS